MVSPISQNGQLRWRNRRRIPRARRHVFARPCPAKDNQVDQSSISNAFQLTMPTLWRLPAQFLKLSCFFLRLFLYAALICVPFVGAIIQHVLDRRTVIVARYKRDGGSRHTCDLYLPEACVEARARGKTTNPTAPVVLFVPGGAWIVAHKFYGVLLCKALARVGVLCIAVDYRCWPQTSIDGMIEDTDAAIEWTLRNCADYGGDPSRVVLVGLSSGAQTCSLLLAQRAADEIRGMADSLAETAAKRWACSDLHGFIGLGGIYQFDYGFLSHLHRKGIDFLLQRLIFGHTASVREARSPLALLHRQPEIARLLPPVLLLHGTDDKIAPVEQSKNFCSKLLESGARDVRLNLYEGGSHNDPVIHAPLMNDHGAVRDIVLTLWSWGLRTTEVKNEGAVAPSCGMDWQHAASEATCKECITALLPSWPRLPAAFINLIRILSPF
eukprot:TRINITY_DN77615_c0_g1_i1.p1 TRINITY_DN77615_c0_g1~~TRINITY_DN77615_c0_g1_i1.p1  ORF type:complete len:440 (+),score=45.39 TRINITY_DN77615_c0_g1_i1:80-1399(+)